GEGFAPAAADYFHQRLATLGIELYEETRVESLAARQANLADGKQLPFDLCVWSAGFVIPRLAADAGLGVDEHGRALVDEQLRPRVLTGRLAVLSKALICVSTYAVVRGELRSGLKLYSWPQPEHEWQPQPQERAIMQSYGLDDRQVRAI